MPCASEIGDGRLPLALANPTIAAPALSITPIEQAEAFAAATGAPINHGGDAFIGTPTSTAAESYYSTLLHKLTHNADISQPLSPAKSSPASKVSELMQRSVLCFLGAGYSSIAGVPLAKNLFRPNYLLAMSERSDRRFTTVREHYENWQQSHPAEYPEQYLGHLYNRVAGPNAPQWAWAVEYVSVVIASAGTPPSSLNRNPRYSNRVNRPSGCAIHRQFWDTILGNAGDLAVVTTNYDLLIERTLRHRPMRRPPSPGCFYGGLPRPQHLKGAAQPFSIWSPERLIEMTGTIPVYKLHGSLSWSLTGQTVVTYQDMRSAFRHGGNAAIIPPIPEKLVPAWLKAVWYEAALALRQSNVWVICGYSAPAYDTEVLRLLSDGGIGRPLTVLLLSPDSDFRRTRWKDIIPEATIIPLPGLPEGIPALADHLAAL